MTGDFLCHKNKLVTLEGGPEYVSGDFVCYRNELTSLEGAPRHVGGKFSCSTNKLTSLKGAPEYVGGLIDCSTNKLTSLEGAPIRCGGIYCNNNDTLTSLKDIHKHVKEINGYFKAVVNPIKSHVLGLLLIKGITLINLKHAQVEEILNRHLGKGRAGMLMAQEELIEAGLEEFAQL